MPDPSQTITNGTEGAGQADPESPLPPATAHVPGARVPNAALCLLLAALAFLPRLSPPWDINHDVAWYSYAAGRVLDGATLYVDVVDVNPPLIIYLHTLPAALARLLGRPEIPVLNACLCLLALVSLSLSYRVLARSSIPAGPASRRFLFLVAVCVLVIGPETDFGQREHIMFMALLPYVLAGAGRAQGRPLSGTMMFGIGLLAGVGLSLKPYFLLAPLAVQAYLLFGPVGRRVWRSPENIGLLTAVGLYALHFLFLPEQVRDAFLGIVHMARACYGLYDLELRSVIVQKHVLFCMVLVVVFLFLPPHKSHDRLCRVLLSVMGALFVAALWQRKGWPYHFWPAQATGWLLVAVRVVGLWERPSPARSWVRRCPSALLLTLGLVVPVGVATERHFRSGAQAGLAQHVRAIQRDAAGEPIAALSTLVYPLFPLVNYTGLEWSLRFNCLWLVPGTCADADALADPFPYHSPEEMGPVERYVIESVVADFKARPPGLVFVQKANRKGIANPRFDFIAYFSRDPEFARIWSQYENLRPFPMHQVFRRRNQPEHLTTKAPRNVMNSKG